MIQVSFKKAERLLSCLYVCIVLIMLAATNPISSPTLNSEGFAHPEGNEILTYELEDHSPVVIMGNQDFVNQEWPGSGTFEEPYLIANLRIVVDDNDDCLIIKNTNAHFIIENCSLEGDFLESAFDFDNVNNCIIRNCVSTNMGMTSYIRYSENITFVNNEFSGLYNIIRCTDSKNFTICDNIFRDGDFGVFAQKHNHCRIVNNQFLNIKWDAVRFDNSDNSLVVGNYIYGRGKNGDGGIQIGSTNYVIENNTLVNAGFIWTSKPALSIRNNSVNGLPLAWLHNASNVVVSGGVGQVILIYCNNITVTNTETGACGRSIQIYHSSNVTVTNNSCRNNYRYGIYCRDSKSVNITANFIEYGQKGIYLWNVYFEGEDNIISKNRVHDCLFPIHIDTEDCTVSWNTMMNTTYNDMQDDGEGNNIHHNYYPNYDGEDADNDGIGDTPYSIYGDAGNEDLYPLMYKTAMPMLPDFSEIYTNELGTPFVLDILLYKHNPFLSVSISDNIQFHIEGFTIHNATVLDLGNYSLTICLKDWYDAKLEIEILIVIEDTIAPTLVAPETTTFENNSVAEVYWKAYDLRPATYSLIINSQTHIYGLWNSSTELIGISLVYLEQGEHNVTLLVVDSSGNSAVDSVTITILVTEPTSSTPITTPTTPSDTALTDPTDSMSQQLIIVTTLSSIIVVLIAGALVFRSRRQGG